MTTIVWYNPQLDEIVLQCAIALAIQSRDLHEKDWWKGVPYEMFEEFGVHCVDVYLATNGYAVIGVL